MKLLHMAAAVMNQTPLDWKHNAKNIRQAIAAARDRGVAALCLPELCLTGYGCEDAFLGANTHQRAQQLGIWVERFFKLWCRNQWKRERYAPSFHLDDENLDPKTWCRFPILSGGFEMELEALRQTLCALS